MQSPTTSCHFLPLKFKYSQLQTVHYLKLKSDTGKNINDQNKKSVIQETANSKALQYHGKRN
jgi:hypothetical protein